jgi:hypothetical protein
MGVASATTMKLVVIVVIAMAILQIVAKKTGIKVTRKEGTG